MALIFDEKSMLDQSLFQYEQRLRTHLNKYVENGLLLTEYFSQDENSTTVDRGTQTIDQLFGKSSPLRYNLIIDLPLSGFGQANPDNSDENNVEDVNVEGDCTILPSTVVPKQYDFFIIKHLKMDAVFEVTGVTYDSMKVDGFYKIHYRLHSTSRETIQQMRSQCINVYHCDLNAVGSTTNPIIKEDDFNKKLQVELMLNKMINSYRAMYYNSTHNCFLFHNQNDRLTYFDMCGNEFMAKHGIMNYRGANEVIMLQSKIRDIQLPEYYANSVYNWLEMGAPARMIRKFAYIFYDAEGYPDSSFALWGDGDIQIAQPLGEYQDKNAMLSFFTKEQFDAFLDEEHEPTASEYDKLIWKYIHKQGSLSIDDISLYTADPLLNGGKYNINNYLYAPIAIFIIRRILRMN